MINQTPWSSYITLRKKLIDPNHTAVKTYPNSQENTYKVSEVNRELKKKNKALEVALSEVEKEQWKRELRNKESVDHLQESIDNLEDFIKELQTSLKEKEADIAALEKEKESKDKIIRNLNTGFNVKVKELKLEIEALEEFRAKKIKEDKEALKKEV